MVRSLLFCLGLGFSLALTAAERQHMVDRLLPLTSVAASINNLPSQLSQLPVLLPVEGQAKHRLTDLYLNALSTSFEAETALAGIRSYLIQNVEKQHLSRVLQWYESPLGRQVAAVQRQCAAEISDIFQVSTLSDELDAMTVERRRLLSTIVKQLAYTQTMFSLMESMMPTMMEAMAKRSGQVPLSSYKLAEFQTKFEFRMFQLRRQLEPILERHLLAAYAYTYREFSDTELSAFIAFNGSAAGSRYLQQLNASYAQVGLDWLTQVIPTIIGREDLARTAALE